MTAEAESTFLSSEHRRLKDKLEAVYRREQEVRENEDRLEQLSFQLEQEKVKVMNSVQVKYILYACTVLSTRNNEILLNVVCRINTANDDAPKDGVGTRIHSSGTKIGV